MEYKKQKNYNFDWYYKQKGYPKNVWPILNEYFSRYQSKFDLTDEELVAKFNKVINNIDTITIEGSSKETSLGCFYPSLKKLSINIKRAERINDDDEEILSTIFHELNHAGERGITPEENTSFKQYNPNTNSWEGTALNEIITEMKADLLAKNTTQNLSQTKNGSMRKVELGGYSDLIFIGTMIHTTLGLTEKEFIKLADQGKTKFDEEMSKRFSDPQTYYDFIQSVSYYADTLHAIKYNNEKPELSDEDMLNMQNCVNEIYDHCLYAMDSRVRSKCIFEKHSVDVLKLMQEARFNLSTLSDNYMEGMVDLKDTRDIYPSDNYFYQKITDTIVSFESIERSKKNISIGSYMELYYNIALDNTSNIREVINSYGIDTNKAEEDFEKTEDMSYTSYVISKYYGDDYWDNSKVGSLISDFKKGGNFIEKIKGKMGELFSRVKRKPRYLYLMSEQFSMKNGNNEMTNTNRSSLSLGQLVNSDQEYEMYVENDDNNRARNNEEPYHEV